MTDVSDLGHFPCPDCHQDLGPLDKDVDEPNIYVCDACDWEGERPND